MTIVTIEIECFVLDKKFAKKNCRDNDKNIYFYNFKIDNFCKQGNVTYKVVLYNYKFEFGLDCEELSIPEMYEIIRDNKAICNVDLGITKEMIRQVEQIFIDISDMEKDVKNFDPDNYKKILLDGVLSCLEKIPGLNPDFYPYYITGFKNIFFEDSNFWDNNDFPFEKYKALDKSKNEPEISDYSPVLWEICDGPKFVITYDETDDYLLDDEKLDLLQFPREFVGSFSELEKCCARILADL